MADPPQRRLLALPVEPYDAYPDSVTQTAVVFGAVSIALAPLEHAGIPLIVRVPRKGWWQRSDSRYRCFIEQGDTPRWTVWSPDAPHSFPARPHTALLHDCAVNREGTLAALTDADNRLTVVSLAGSAANQVFPLDTQEDGSKAVPGDLDFYTDPFPGPKIRFSPAGDYIATRTSSRRWVLTPLDRSRKRRVIYSSGTDPVTFSPDGLLLADGVSIIPLREPGPRVTLSQQEFGWPQFSPSGDRLLVIQPGRAALFRYRWPELIPYIARRYRRLGWDANPGPATEASDRGSRRRSRRP